MGEHEFTEAEFDGAHSELCKREFRDFVEAVSPIYIFNWHHLVLIDALQRLAERKIRRLIVMLPPRHGKSELVSRLFPAWLFGRNQDEQVIEASYSYELASAMNRDCQKIIGSEAYKKIFPNTRLADKRDTGAVKTHKRFDIVGGKGYYVSAGVGGGITGVGSTCGIVDDPVKDASEADSTVYRDRAWDWYRTTFKTRFEPGAIEVICQTRWHEDDLTGRILAQGVDEFTEVICLPAICESADEDYREIGDALWEDRYPRADLLAMSDPAGTSFIGSRTWNALYQQRPAADEGNMIKRQWFQRYDIRNLDLTGKRVNFYFDTAYTDNEKNDPTAGIAYVKDGADFYVLECTAKWIDFIGQVEFVKEFCARNGYSSLSLARIEPKATGKSVVQVMKKGTGLNVIEAISPKESKPARVNSVLSVIEGGRVYLPEGMEWVSLFLDECASFPNAAHDDRVDCLTGMILSETGQKKPFRRPVR